MIFKKRKEELASTETNTYTYMLTSNLDDYKKKERKKGNYEQTALYIVLPFYFILFSSYTTHVLIHHDTFLSLLTVIQRRDKDYRCMRVSLKKKKNRRAFE